MTTFLGVRTIFWPCAGAYVLGMDTASDTSTAAKRRFEEYVCALGAVVGNDARCRGLTYGPIITVRMATIRGSSARPMI